MNTPAHAALNLWVLGRREGLPLPVALGAVGPDLPMLGFYGWERAVRGVPEGRIWSERYFDPAWQVVFDVPHSIPILLVGLGVAWALSRPIAVVVAASMLLHALADLPLHREDAHRHFFPLSEWRFVSPVSYWDPRHWGIVAGIAEIALVVAASVFLLRRYRDRLGRGIVIATGVLYGLYIAFAIFMWSGLTG